MSVRGVAGSARRFAIGPVTPVAMDPRGGFDVTRAVILEAGTAGNTAALHLPRMLNKKHRVVVVSPNSRWNWIPSNVWSDVGKMTTDITDVPRPTQQMLRLRQNPLF